MRITTCFTSAMVPLQPLGSALPAADLRAALAAAAPPTPTAAAAAAALPSAVYCRKRRRLTPGTTGWPGCHTGPVGPCGCSRELSELVICSILLMQGMDLQVAPVPSRAPGEVGRGAGDPLEEQSVRWRRPP